MRQGKGFTLVELVMSIIIIAICAIPTALMFQQAAGKSFITRVTTVATALAEEKMEETLGLGFSGVTDSGPTAFSSPFSDYSYQVTVYYVQAADLNTSVSPTVTAYKNVEVRISHSAVGTVSLMSLLTSY